MMNRAQFSYGGFMSRRPRSKKRSREIDPPYRDPVFMESLPARPVRILTEYIDPLERLRREKEEGGGGV